MEEEFKKAITELGGDSKHVQLEALKAKMRSYFRRALFKPVWEEDTMTMFFQSRPAEWDFDEKTRGVRVLNDITKQIQKTVSEKRKKAPFPEALYTQVLKSGTQQETLLIVDKCVAAELAAMPIDSIEALLESVGPPPTVTDPLQAAAQAFMHKNGQIKVLCAVPGALDKKGGGLGQLLEFYGKVVKFGGEQVDPRVNEQKIKTLKELCEMAGALIRDSKPQPFSLGAVGPKTLMMLCHTAPFHITAAAVAALGDKGDGEDVKACAATLSRVPVTVLEGLSQQTLLQLAVAATKSGAVAEATVGLVAKACAAVLPAWSMDDISKLLLALSKAKVGADGAEVAEVYGRACEALSSKLTEMSAMHLIKVALVLGKVPACKEFFEALAVEAANKASDMPAAQLLILTQGLLPLGGDNASVKKVLDVWAAGLGGEAPTAKLTADQLAKLAQLAAPAAPSHADFWKSLGARLVAEQKALTEPGWASAEAAFPDGAGPEFEGKEGLSKALKERKEKEEEKKQRAEKKRSRSRGGGRSRSRDRKGGDRRAEPTRRSRSRDRGRGGGRSRSRDRRR